MDITIKNVNSEQMVKLLNSLDILNKKYNDAVKKGSRRQLESMKDSFQEFYQGVIDYDFDLYDKFGVDNFDM